MSATTARRRSASRPYRIVHVTQHWRIRQGAFYRDCLVELPDGTMQLRAIRDDLVEVAA